MSSMGVTRLLLSHDSHDKVQRGHDKALTRVAVCAHHPPTGGAPWAAFSAAEETVDVPAAKQTAAFLRDGLPRIVPTYA